MAKYSAKNEEDFNPTNEQLDIDDFYAKEDDSDDGGNEIKGEIYIEKKDFTLANYKQMVDDGELILRPEYQRNFVIDLKFASRLIESIILDVPIPSVFLAEEANGKYSVIDGQQRLTAFICFLNGTLLDGTIFKLTGLKVLPVEKGRGQTYSQIENEAIKRKIKNTTIQAIIIKNNSHEDLKFAIFERLNTGSVKLNEDELRNSIYRGSYIKLLSELEDNSTFHTLVNNANWKKRMLYRGMILRFFALSTTYSFYKSSMKQFCNKELRDNRRMEESKKKEYKERFDLCVELVKTVFGVNAFRRFLIGNKTHPDGKWSLNRVNMALFDIQMCGFVPYKKSDIIPKADEIREAMLRLMCDRDFIDCLELKTSDTNVLKKRFEIWTAELKKIVGHPRIDKRLFTIEQKEKLFEKAKHKCAICNQKILAIEDAEADHIKPYSQGGATELENGQITHRFCNRQKSNKNFALEIEYQKDNSINIFAQYQGNNIVAKYDSNNETITYKGEVYSPSGAGKQAKIDLGASNSTSVNGWTFWKFKDENKDIKLLEELRSKN